MLSRSSLRRCISQFNASKDYYKLLKVAPNASHPEIKKSYHDLARVYHPDAKTGNENKFKDIAEAFEVLGDEKIRGEYDAVRRKSGGGERTPRQDSGFDAQSFKEANFAKMSDREKIRRAAERHEKWQKASQNFYQTHPSYKAWSSGQHSATGPSQYYSTKENKPGDAISWLFEFMAYGILLCLSYWSAKTLYGISTLASRAGNEDNREQPPPQPVFRQTRAAQRAEFKPQTHDEAIARAKVTRNKFVESSK